MISISDPPELTLRLRLRLCSCADTDSEPTRESAGPAATPVRSFATFPDWTRAGRTSRTGASSSESLSSSNRRLELRPGPGSGSGSSGSIHSGFFLGRAALSSAWLRDTDGNDVAGFDIDARRCERGLDTDWPAADAFFHAIEETSLVKNDASSLADGAVDADFRFLEYVADTRRAGPADRAARPTVGRELSSASSESGSAS
jgi:hypothetical protein